MPSTKRIRLELDADTYECARYMASLRGISLGSHLRKIVAVYQSTAEGEFKPLAAHMFAWRQALAHLDPVLEYSPSTKDPLDDIPY